MNLSTFKSFEDQKKELEEEVTVGFEIGTMFGGLLTVTMTLIMLQ